MGTKVQLINMEDEKGVTSGKRGTVMAVDSMATIHVHWDNGSILGVAYGEVIAESLPKRDLKKNSCPIKKLIRHSQFK